LYKYIFGPVSSRRFGLSLGIDLSPYEKSCNFDCLYCELKKSKPTNKIKNEPDVNEIVKEVQHFLSENPYPDVITITANGEPTLYSKLDELVSQLNKIKENSKLLILTNGSTVFNRKIQDVLKKIDIVKVSLDSANPEIFKKIDKVDIDVNKIIEGLKSFRKKYKGTLILEILIVKNINDKEEDIKELAKVLKEINPDRIDMGTIDRPPAYRVFPVSNETLLKLSDYFEGLNINVVYRKEKSSAKFTYLEEDIINTLKRRPFTSSDIENLFSEKSKSIFNRLLAENIVKSKKVGNIDFYYV